MSRGGYCGFKDFLELFCRPGEGQRPSGPGQAMQMAAHAAQGLASGDSSNIAIKAATLKQLNAILAIVYPGLTFLR